MSFRTTLARVAILAGAGTAALAGTAAAASAAPVPNGPVHQVQHRHYGPEYFTITETLANQNGTVNANGVFSGRNGTLGSNNAGTVAILQFRHGTVSVAHPVTPQPKVNLKTCTASVVQYGNWHTTAATGIYRGVQAKGSFWLTENAKFKVVAGHCQAGNPNANPVSFKLSVTAWGYGSSK